MTEMHTTNLRFGHVTEYDPSRHMARVNFPDIGIVSYWLPVLVSNSLRNHDETHLDIGEHVACMMSGIGAEMGVVLGAFYDDKNTPPVKDSEVRAVTFDDGSRITYNRSTHTLTVESTETVNIYTETANVYSSQTRINASEHAAISSPEIGIEGNLTMAGTGSTMGSNSVKGNTYVEGRTILEGKTEITGNIILKGNITLDGDVSCPGWCVDK